jgi:hypothetical protein
LTEEIGFVKELRHVEVPLVDQALCNSSSLILKTSFCVGARDGKADPCKGKLSCFYRWKYSLEILLGPGSGMVLEIDGLWKIVGMASTDIIANAENVKTCILDDYLFYTDIAKYQEWIYQVMFNFQVVFLYLQTINLY